MAHQRKSELNRFLQDAVNPDIPYGLPTDDLHPDGEPQANVPPPGAPQRGKKIDENASVNWGETPGEETGVNNPEKPDQAA